MGQNLKKKFYINGVEVDEDAFKDLWDNAFEKEDYPKGYLNKDYEKKNHEGLKVIPPEQIDLSKFQKIDNVEIRKEFIRKVGLERILPYLDAKKIDSQTRQLKEVKIDGHRTCLLKSGNYWQYQQGDVCIEYDKNISDRLGYDSYDGEKFSIQEELFELNLGTIKNKEVKVKALKMQNPSVREIWHLEYVGDKVRTCQEAHNWRAFGDSSKEWKPIVLT